MVSCDDLDGGMSYLRADYRTDCYSPTHQALQIYAACTIAIYTVGIPVLYVVLLFRNRKVLMYESARR